MASRKKSSALYLQPPPLRFGAWLRALRGSKGLALREVASAIEMDQAHLSKAELGQRVPTADQVTRLATFFGVSETQMEARRVAEKALQEIESSPLGQEALCIIREEPIELNLKK
jgi:HTH-type transcriptional regulator, competence development regulator